MAKVFNLKFLCKVRKCWLYKSHCWRVVERVKEDDEWEKSSAAVRSRMNFDFFPFLLTSSTIGLLFVLGVEHCHCVDPKGEVQTYKKSKIPPMPLWWWWRNIEIHFSVLARTTLWKKGSWNRTEQGEEEKSFFNVSWSESTLSGQ